VVSGASIEIAVAADAEAVASATVFEWDRYHADPMLPAGGADAVHRALVRQACQRQGADIAWVARDADGVLGFTAGVLDPLMRDVLGLPTLTITLAATAPRARRRGVGRALAAHAIRWAAAQGLAAIEVGAPLRNIAAARTYESAGFRLVASRLTFRSGRGPSE
jgi:ribosomal protein S18 acetylase RimI-like enzyme